VIIHRFVFLSPVQLPGKAPTLVFEPAAAGNHGHTARRLPDGWLFCGPPGATSGLSTSGRDELAAIGENPDGVALGVLVPHSQVVVHYAGEPFLYGDQLPDSAPSFELGTARLKAAESQHKVEAQPPPPPEPPAAVAIAPPPTASRRRTPAGMAPPPPPPPSVGWVDE
jgi:hypothetical protein